MRITVSLTVDDVLDKAKDKPSYDLELSDFKIDQWIKHEADLIEYECPTGNTYILKQRLQEDK